MIVRVLTKLKISLSPRATLNLPDPLPIRPCIILIIPPHRQSIFYSPLFKLAANDLPPLVPSENHVIPLKIFGLPHSSPRR